jgi:hypothetical protein
MDSSVPRIAVSVVKLFFYLRVKFLDLRRVSRFFAERRTKYKTMLRKVYTVASCLEIVGIVKKTSVVSQIQLSIPLDSEISALELNITSLLNTKEEVEEQKTCERRRREFTIMCTELADAHRFQEIQARIKPVFEPLEYWGLT